LVILSGERTAFILFFIFIIFSLNIKDFRKVFFIILIFLLSLFIINPKIFNNEFTDRIILNTLSQVGFPSLGINERIRVFSPVHEHHYISGIKMFLKNPILGIGPNNFREECKKEKYFVKKIPFMEEKIYARSDGYFLYNKNSIATYHYFSIQNNTYERHAEEISISEKIYLDTETNKTDTKFFKNDYIFSYKSNLNIIGCNTHPHNYTVQFLSETGVVGFLFYFSLIGYCLYQIILIIFQKNYKLNAEYFMLVSIMISLFPLLPSGNFFNNMVSFNIFWNLPFYLFFLKKTSK
jgi:O-antigen ligase